MLESLSESLLSADENTSSAGESVSWSPETTRAFLTCLARFEGEEIGKTSFTLDDRLDNEMLALFRSRGVAEDRSELIQDEQATRAVVQERFVASLSESSEGETLLFYYGSHGGYDAKTGKHNFSAFDETIDVEWFFDAIEKHFKGDRALMFADTCYSGGIVEIASRCASRISYAALSSTFSHNVGWSGWRFVESLMRGFGGDPVADVNGDGKVDFGDLARFVERHMSFAAEGKPMFTTTYGFSPNLVLANVSGEKAHPLIGAHVEVKCKSGWYTAEVLKVDDGQLFVHYTSFNHDDDEWVSADRVRRFEYSRFEPGAAVEAQASSSKKWYPAHVLRAWRTMHLVRWDAWGPEYDEWMGPSRIRAPR